MWYLRVVRSNEHAMPQVEMAIHTNKTVHKVAAVDEAKRVKLDAAIAEIFTLVNVGNHRREQTNKIAEVAAVIIIKSPASTNNDTSTSR